MKKLLSLLAVILLAGTAALSEADLTLEIPLRFEDQPEAYQAAFYAEMASALENARNRVPEQSLLTAQAKGDVSPYTGSKSDHDLTVAYTVSDSVVPVGERVYFRVTFTCDNGPVTYTYGGQTMDQNFDPTGPLTSEKPTGSLGEEGQPVSKSKRVFFEPQQAGYFNFVIVAADSDGNLVSLTTPTIQVYEGDEPAFDNIGTDQDTDGAPDSALVVRVETDRTSVPVGGEVTATVSFSAVTDPVSYAGTWTLYDENGTAHEAAKTSGQVNAREGGAVRRFSYQALKAGELRFELSASDGDQNAVDIQSSYIVVEDRYFVTASLTPASVISAGNPVQASYTIHGHSCEEETLYIGWECYEEADTNGDGEIDDAESVLAASSRQRVSQRSGSVSFTPYVGQQLLFYAEASCPHFPETQPLQLLLTIVGGLQDKPVITAALDADSICLGASVKLNYSMSGGSGSVNPENPDSSYVQWLTSDGSLLLMERISEVSGVRAFRPDAPGEYLCKLVIQDAYSQTASWTSPVFTVTDAELTGDADENGTVNLQDALRIMQYRAGWPVSIERNLADADKNGTVTVEDALKILQIMETINSAD